VTILAELADIYLAGAAEARERAARLGDAATAGPLAAPEACAGIATKARDPAVSAR